MAAPDKFCYVYIQLPGTTETVPCASLRVKTVAAGMFEGTFTYGKRYLARSDVTALDPYHLPLSSKPLRCTKLKGIPGAVRDASPDAWGRRVIQAKLELPEESLQEMDYLLNGPDDGAGNLSFGRSLEPPGPRRPFNKTHQLEALTAAAEMLEEDGRLAHEVLESLNDDHPRNHAMLRTPAGWRLSPAYDIVPVPLVSQEHRDLALTAGSFGRTASVYNLLSRCDVFGLSLPAAQHEVASMLQVVKGWREFFVAKGVAQKSIDMLAQAMLPASFFLDAPNEPLY